MDERKMITVMENFCRFDCTHKRVLIESPYADTEVIVNGDVVYCDRNDNFEIEMCDHCPIKDFVRCLADYRD